MIKALGLAHAVLTVTNIDQTRKFYQELLDIEIEKESENSFSLSNANIPIWFVQWENTDPDDVFTETRVGLDHISIEVATEEDLQSIVSNLKKLEISTNGIEYFDDKYPYVAFRDPDNIQTEFFVNQHKE